MSVVAPLTHENPGDSAVAVWEQRRVPAEKALHRQFRFMSLSCVEHHIDHAVHISVRRSQCPYVHTQSARDGRSNGIMVEYFALYFAGLEHVLR